MPDRISIALIALMLVSVLVAWSPVQEDKKLPSEIKKDINQDFREFRKSLGEDERLTNEQWYAKRAEFTRKHLSNIKTTGLSREDTYAYGELLYDWAKMNDEAKGVFAELAKGDDLVARKANKQVISLAIEDENETTAKVRTMIASHRTRFPLTIDDSLGLYFQVSALAGRLKEEGDNTTAIAIIKEEIASLNYEKPYGAWPIILEMEHHLEKEEALALIKQHRKKFESIVKQRKENTSVADTDKEAYGKETRQWEGLVWNVLSNENRIRVTNGPAPDFTFTNFFNTEPITFSELRGKVVVIDFWANWCGPCIGTFPELRKMHEKYEGTDVKIIGITGFQGSMANHGQDRVTDISEEKELELTQVFIDHHKVTWPIAFSTRNCYDIEYGIQGVPTMVIIDKKGIVRMFEHPANKDKIIKLIEELRAE